MVNKADITKEFNERLKAFTKSADALLETMEKDHTGEYFSGYPFDRCFREIVSLIHGWGEAQRTKDNCCLILLHQGIVDRVYIGNYHDLVKKQMAFAKKEGYSSAEEQAEHSKNYSTLVSIETIEPDPYKSTPHYI